MIRSRPLIGRRPPYPLELNLNLDLDLKYSPKNGDVFRSEPSQHFRVEQVRFLVRIGGLEKSPKTGRCFLEASPPPLIVDRVRIFAWTESAFLCRSVVSSRALKRGMCSGLDRVQIFEWTESSFWCGSVV